MAPFGSVWFIVLFSNFVPKTHRFSDIDM